MKEFYQNPNIKHYAGASELNEERKHIFYCWPALKRHVRGNVLDIGAGQGQVTDRLTKDNRLVKSVTVIDYGNYHKKLLQKRGYKFVSHDLDTYPYIEGKQYDTIISTDVLEHVLSPYLHLLEIHRLLKKGGRLVLSTPEAKIANMSVPHINYFTAQSLEILFKRIGFKKITRVYNGVINEQLTAVTSKVPVVRNILNNGLYYVVEK